MSWSKHPLPKNWPTLTRQILTRDNRVCHICHQPGATQVDHITPRSQGGTHHPTNLAAICTTCHRAKTAQEANSARRRKYSRLRTPEPHPGLRQDQPVEPSDVGGAPLPDRAKDRGA